MFMPSIVLKLALTVLREWLPKEALAALIQFLPQDKLDELLERIVHIVDRFDSEPDQLEFELGAVKAEVKALLEGFGVSVDGGEG
jgi:hypothetical protein